MIQWVVAPMPARDWQLGHDADPWGQLGLAPSNGSHSSTGTKSELMSPAVSNL